MNEFNTIIASNIGVLTVLTGLVALTALVVAVIALMRALSVARPFAWLSGQWDGEVDSLPALLQTVERNTNNVSELRAGLDKALLENKTHYKRIGLVRYDAFEGIAGQQSSVLCVLDDNKNGFVLSNLVGRDYSRSFAIEISDGEAPRKLGDEESKALSIAMKD